MCTLPDILWDNHDWKRIGMGEMMEPKQVVTAYRKFIRRFHPDRFENEKDVEKIFIANRAFAAINEQYNLFRVSLLLFLVL